MRTALWRVILSIVFLAWLSAAGTAFGQGNVAAELIPPGEPQAAAVQPNAPQGIVADSASPFQTASIIEAPDASACQECGQEDCWCNHDLNCCPPDWYLSEGTRIMHRGAGRAIPLTGSLGINSQTGQLTFAGNVLDGRGIKFDVDAGYDTTFGHYLGRDSSNRDQFIEFTYYGLNNWIETRNPRGTRIEATASDGLTYSFGNLVAGDASGGFPFAVTGFNRADSHSFTYRSRFDNFELNLRLEPRKGRDRLVLYPNGRWRRECYPGCRLSYLVGVRAIIWDEGFNWLAEGTTTEVDDPTNSTHSSGHYSIRTQNDLVGFQVGAEAMFKQNLWEYGFRVKVAPMIDFAGQESTILTEGAATDPFSSGQTDLDIHRHARRSKASIYLEWGFVGRYYLRPNFHLYAGYDMAWLIGVALAPSQINYQTDAASTVDANGHLFLQGLQLGAQMIW